jgi:hypothetical protein
LARSPTIVDVPAWAEMLAQHNLIKVIKASCHVCIDMLIHSRYELFQHSELKRIDVGKQNRTPQM